jgi:hypothetical protein
MIIVVTYISSRPPPFCLTWVAKRMLIRRGGGGSISCIDGVVFMK